MLSERPINTINLLSQANKAFRNHDYKTAVEIYQQYAQQGPEHQQRIAVNLKLAEARLNGYKKHAEQYNKTAHTTNDKIVVYTVNIGGYESVKEPTAIDPTVEYILFTDNKDLKSKHWKTIQLTEKLDDPRRTSRLPKILAHKYLPEHDISVYIDSSLEIKTPDLRQMIAECMEGKDIALYKHYKRDCVYDEINFVTNSTDRVVANKELCKQALKKYEDINYPKNNGLFENAFIFRRNTKKIQHLNELWWKEYQAGTERDQFVFMYALNQTGIKPNVIKVGKEFRKNPYLSYYRHSYLPSHGDPNFQKLSQVFVKKGCERFKRIIDVINNPAVKVVSFDIFDTLVIRKVFDPKDIFRLMAKKDIVKNIFGFYDFAEARIQAESTIRKKITDKPNGVDPTFNQIYFELQKKFKLEDDQIELLKKHELEYEANALEKHVAVKAIYDLAIAKGKTVIIVSDMYLPLEFLENVLRREGFVGYHKLYLSSHIGKSKKHGDIYPFIINDLNVRSYEVLHLGDNLHSDIKMAEKQNVKAIRLFDVQKRFVEHLSNDLTYCFPSIKAANQLKFLSTKLNYALILRKYFSESLNDQVSINTSEKLGYCVLGPFLLTLVLRIRRKSVELGLDKFLWLARDGYLPYKANNILDKYLGQNFESTYLPISRKMLFPIYLEDESGLDQLFKISYQNNFLVYNFINERFGEIGLEILKEHLGEKYEVVVSQHMFEHHDFINQLLDESFDKIKAVHHSKALDLDAYYKSVINSEEKFGLFDVGRKGTFQKFLTTRYKTQIHGFYVVNSIEISNNVGFRYDNFLPLIDPVSNLNNPDTIIYELLLSDVDGSFLGIDSNKFIRSRKKVNGIEENFIKAAHDAALSFINDALVQFGNDIVHMEQQPFYASYGMENAHQNLSVRNLFSTIPHYDEMSTNKPKMLIEVFDKPMEIHKYNCFPKKTTRRRVVFYSPAITRIRGGAERVASRLANFFDSVGYDILLVSSANPNASTKTVYDVSPSVYVRNINVNDHEANSDLFKSFEADCALVLASGSVLINITKALQLSNTPFMLSERADPAASLEIYWKDFSYADYNRIYSTANLISVQFDSFKKFYTKQNQKKMVTLANPFELPTLDLEKPRKKRIICAARIWFTQKRQDILLNAFASIAKNYPDWMLEFYGNAYGEDAKILQEKANNLRIQNQVKISVSVDNIHEVFEDSAIFVLPSVFEGFPNSLAEALSYGLPSIGFKSCPGVNQLIVNGENGYLVADTSYEQMIEGLSVALDSLISKPDERKLMAVSAVDSMKKYSDRNVLPEWHKVLKQLLSY